MSNRVLFFGPYPTPFTGQAISFRQAYETYQDEKILFDTTKFKSNKLLNSIYCIIFLPIVFFTKKIDKIYFTCTRSGFGFFKDFELLLLARFFNKKVVNHLHGADLKIFYENAGFLKPLIMWSYGCISTNIVLLPSMKDQFSSFTNSSVEVVSNCFSSDFEKYNVNLTNKKKQIVFLSNLIYSKGIFVFLDAVEELLITDNELVVKIAGLPMGDDTCSVREVEQKFSKISNSLILRYPNRFFYLGNVNGKVKENLLKESSIFILPTFYKTEAFPITIIEAMYFGNAIITTKHNYLEDIIHTSNGYLVSTKSSKEIVDKVMILFDNKNHLEKIQKFNNIEAKLKYSPGIFNKKINQIIKDL